MKLYKVNGCKLTNHQTSCYYAYALADGLSSREAAERMATALATQGAWSLSIESYDADDEE